MSWKVLSIPAIALMVLLGVAVSGHDRSDFDERIPVGPGGSVAVDVELGGGLSFDHGSLHIRSHDADDVRVVADTTGWGKYAVDLDLSHEREKVELVGQVDGPLDWMFGGPTVRLSIWVPRDFTVDASIRGGPLVLEDLVGPITARVDETDVTLRRAEGRVLLTSGRGSIEVEDVDGELEVRSGRGAIDVVGVRGSVRVSTGRGDVEIASVAGPVTVESDGGRVEIDRVRGDVAVTTDRARIDAEDVEGNVVASTQRGGIQLQEIDGTVRARSERGSIEVEFEGDPRGEIETSRGGIEIEVPEGAGFDLDARTARGRIEIGDVEAEDDEEQESSDDSQERDDAADDDRDWGGSREAQVVRSINGGGPPLRLRTGRGTIRVED